MRIQLELRKGRSPIFLNHKPLKKLLKLWGLVALRRVKGKKKSGIEKILEFLREKVNLVKRLKKEVDLFELFFTDFTRLVYQNGKKALWFCSYFEARTKGVLGFSLSPNPDTKTILEGYRKIKEFLKREREEMERVMIHQDQGSPFRSYEYVGELIKDGVTLSYCRKGKFEDNPEMELFFGRFKDEWKKVISEV